MANILVFTGSTSSTSINESLAQYAAGLLTNHAVHHIDLKRYEAPLYSIDREKKDGLPAPIRQLIQAIDQHDGFIIATPEHNGLMTAHLKNTLDWLSRADRKVFGYKPVLLLSTSPGKRGAKSSLEQTARILGYLGAHVAATYSLGSFYEQISRENGFQFNDLCEEKRLSSIVGNWAADNLK